jgi:hypothetical protein
MASNKLSVIDGDLFKLNSKLYDVDLRYNLIENVGSDFLSQFKNLTFNFKVSFIGNPCLDRGGTKEAFLHTILALEENLLKNCPPLETTPSQTTSSTTILTTTELASSASISTMPTTKTPQQSPATCSSRIKALESQIARYEFKFIELEKMIREMN